MPSYTATQCSVCGEAVRFQDRCGRDLPETITCATCKVAAREVKRLAREKAKAAREVKRLAREKAKRLAEKDKADREIENKAREVACMSCCLHCCLRKGSSAGRGPAASFHRPAFLVGVSTPVGHGPVLGAWARPRRAVPSRHIGAWQQRQRRQPPTIVAG